MSQRLGMPQEKKAFKQLGTGRTKGVEQSERGKGLTTWSLTGREGAGQSRPNKCMEPAAGKMQNALHL